MGINARGDKSGKYPPGYRTDKARRERAAAKMEQQAMVVADMRRMQEEREARVRQREEEKEKVKTKTDKALRELVEREVERAREVWEAEAKERVEKEVREAFRAGWFRGVDKGMQRGRRLVGMAAFQFFGSGGTMPLGIAPSMQWAGQSIDTMLHCRRSNDRKK